MNARAAACVLALAALPAGCRQIGFDARPVTIDREPVTMTNGVRYQEVFLGSGPAAVHDDELLLDYVVTLPDGTRVDSTLERGVPVTMTIGSALVPGLDHALVGMKPGGCRRVFVPAALAYGEAGVEDLVPPDSDLVFDVRLIEVRPQHEDAQGQDDAPGSGAAEGAVRN